MTTTHRIDELLFDLAFESPAMAIARAEELRSLVVDKLLPLVERVFDQVGDQFGDDNVVWQIDRLDVDVGNVTEAELPGALVAGLRIALEEALQDGAGGPAEAGMVQPPQTATGNDTPARRIERHRADSEILLAFLADGTMPWQMDATAPASHEVLLSRVVEQGADAFLQALAASQRRPVMLARLARQFAPAQLQGLLRRMNSAHADALLFHLAALQQLLQDAALSRTLLSGALHAAWEEAFAIGLDRRGVTVTQQERGGSRPSSPSALATRALAWLAGQQQRDVGTVAAQLLRERAMRHGESAPDNEIVHALRKIAGAASSTPTGATAAPVATASPPSFVQETASGRALGKLHEPASAAVPIRNRVTSALTGGNAGDIYDDWRAFYDSQPDLLRSAILHYGSYAEIREKIASTFPLSLLLDMQALLAPEAAALTARVWNDEQLRARLDTDGAVQWSQWRRNWWRGAFAYVQQAERMRAGERDDVAAATSAAAAVTAAVASSSFDITAYAAAALEGAGIVAANKDVSDYVAALAQGRAPRLAQSRQSQQEETQEEKQERIQESMSETDGTVLQASTPASLFEAMRGGAQAVQQLAVSIGQLEQWVREAVREPSFYQAIADHAAVARDRRHYYVQVLQALAQNRIVDLEEFAAAEATPATTPEATLKTIPKAIPLLHEIQTGDALPAIDAAGQMVHPHAGDARTASVATGNPENPENTENTENTEAYDHDGRDKAHLVSRLAKALMKGDPALLYGHWDVLLHKHAPLLGEALRHYGIRDDILERIVASFPESMLYDMAVLLAPAGMSAWLQLRDQAAWALVVGTSFTRGPEIIADEEDTARAPQQDPASPAPAVLAAWKRQLWKAALRYLLRGAGHNGDQFENNDGNGTVAANESRASAQTPGGGIGSTSVHALLAALAGDAELAGRPWQRHYLRRWADSSVRAENVQPDRQGSPQEPLATARASAAPPAEAAMTVNQGAQVNQGNQVSSGHGDDIRAILHHHHQLSQGDVHADADAEPTDLTSKTSASMPATRDPAAGLPDVERADLLQRFARLKNDSARIDTSWAVADLERLVEAHIVAYNPGHGARQQREIFLQAIKAQAPSVSAQASASVFARSRYFTAVLQALLQEQTLDLEEIAAASTMDQEAATDNASVHAAGSEASPKRTAVTYTPDQADILDQANKPDIQHQANQPDQPDQPDQRDSGSRTYIDFLLAPDFRTGAAAPAGLAEWLRVAIDTAAPQVAPALAQLSRHPEAVARLLQLLPGSSWQQLAALAPHSSWQVQRMRRYAGDIADMFAEQNRQLSAADLARFEWRFLLPYLFAPDRIFDPARFTGELVGFLSRESGLPAPAGLTSRLRSQMGITVASPRAVSGTATQANAKPQHNPRADAGSPSSSNEVGNNSNSSNNNHNNHNSNTQPQAATKTDDSAALQTLSGIHIANAGMVLAWPFLSRAWEVLALTREGKFVDDAAAQRAAWLLQFAVDEQTAVPEYQLTLNKLLSGIPLQAPIVPEIEVTEQERELVEQMLGVMISHWKAIGNTSIRGLRETFLQREGTLSRKEDGWRLQVPKKTFDMLLEKLPWSISTIRLPWMEKILWVEWI